LVQIQTVQFAFMEDFGFPISPGLYMNSASLTHSHIKECAWRIAAREPPASQLPLGAGDLAITFPRYFVEDFHDPSQIQLHI
jgi:hypothetical protein